MHKYKETTLPPTFPLYLILSSVGLAVVTKAPESYSMKFIRDRTIATLFQVKRVKIAALGVSMPKRI